jgi:hypothetical protein
MKMAAPAIVNLVHLCLFDGIKRYKQIAEELNLKEELAKLG